MRTATVLCQGVRPLLLHPPIRELSYPPKPPLATVDEACRQAIHADEEGSIALPTAYLLSNLLVAAERMSGRRQHIANGKPHLFNHLNIPQEWFRLLDGNHKPIPYPKDGEKVPWEVDVRRAIGASRELCVVRPRFFPWSFTFDCAYDERALRQAKFLELLRHAGRVGLGAFRPSWGGGSYGTWRPVRVEMNTRPADSEAKPTRAKTLPKKSKEEHAV